MNTPVRMSPFHIALLIAVTLLCGCKSTVCLNSKRSLQPFQGGTQSVFVTNPGLQREYEILKASGIYSLSSQSDGARQLTLHPMQQFGRCANPLLLTGLTLGILPGFLPGSYVFEYEIEKGGAMQRGAHYLPMHERVSVWEWMINRDEDKVLAEALAWSPLGESPRRGTL
jgi:hypothetical protein